MKLSVFRPGLLGLLLSIPALAFAHTGTEGASFMHGVVHPLQGWDHLLAMIAIGVLASRMEGGQRWLLPAAFICAMAAGGALGASGYPLPWVETFIALSLIAFGAAIFFARQPALPLLAIIAAGFALFHGHAHGSEMVAGSVAAYSAGFMMSTATLHGIGLWLSLRVQEFGKRAKTLVRVSGCLIAASGLTLLGMAF